MSTTLTPDVQAVAAALHIRIDGIQAAIIRDGKVLFPAQRQLTVINPDKACHGASFYVPEHRLSAALLLERYNEVEARFLAA